MFNPPNKKYTKYHCYKKNTTIKHKDYNINFGNFALIALNKGFMDIKQIETGRRSITAYLKRKGKVWIRIFPDFPQTKKPNETRMGKGKGNVSHWLSYILPGQVLYEASSKNDAKTIEALEKAAKKLPVRTKIIKKY